MTRGGFAAFTERAKDIIVQQLQAHFGALVNTNVITEMPQIMKFGLAGQTAAESYLDIVTQLPFERQHIPTIAVMSAPGVERKMGIGRQVVATYFDPDTGLPMIRESVGGDMTIVIEIYAVDTNTRSELTDLVMGFFTVYAEEQQFAFLGDSQVDPSTGVRNNYQIIIKSQTRIEGETQLSRPGNEGFDMIYLNRVSVPIIFIDYVDREGYQVDVCPNPNLLTGIVSPIPEPTQVGLATYDTFEDSGISPQWLITTSSGSVYLSTVSAIRGLQSLVIDNQDSGICILGNALSSGITSGYIRTRFRLDSPAVTLVMYAMGDTPNPDNAYWIYVQAAPFPDGRIHLRKGPVVSVVDLAVGSRMSIASGIALAAQLEWKLVNNPPRIRLRGYISTCETDDFGSLYKRLEYTDYAPLTTASWVGLGGIGSGILYVDDVYIAYEVPSAPPFSAMAHI